MKLFCSTEEFVNWILANNEGIVDTDINDLDYLARKICENLFIHTENVATARVDFLAFLKILKLNGIIFKHISNDSIYHNCK